MRTLLMVLVYSFSMTISKGQSISPYMFNNQIESLLHADSTEYKYQFNSFNFSFIGEYKKALETKEKQFTGRTITKPTDEQIAFFSNFKAVDAKNIILKEASKTNVLIINEAHFNSRHRIFLSILLDDLYRLGYKFIGFEALSHEDSLINKRGYPILSSGYYTKEPCFGNLIRESIEKGFKVFPYEQFFNDSLQISFGREKSQALNIKKYIDKYPNDKFIIYCGYDHIVEDTLRNSMGLPMAGQLKKMTGIDPFTIDQTALMEYISYGNKYRQLMTENTYTIYADGNNSYFNRASYPKSIDCNLFQPNTIYNLGRPTWLVTENKKYQILNNKVKIAYPCLIEVYLNSEPIDEAVPIDVIELSSKNEKKAVVIYKGRKHIAVIRNVKGERQVVKLK